MFGKDEMDKKDGCQDEKDKGGKACHNNGP